MAHTCNGVSLRVHAKSGCPAEFDNKLGPSPVISKGSKGFGVPSAGTQFLKEISDQAGQGCQSPEHSVRLGTCFPLL